ncbi:MAG: asparagine synthase (glutamine-hydrolyzing) [Candidatus Aminicenantes bacterium]|nr:asparagine synthase (glutamine-hydrolyzing) [Candidatus Aminicenantes bacterium]
MCGICGFTWEDEAIVRAMADEMAHRGPDQSGFHCAPGIALGHRRLSIIDLSENGRQPIANEDGSLWLVHNGEIYNFREVKRWLEGRNHVFRSRSDSEVILHAYEEEGIDCLRRLNGMFAFALWDARRRRLILARDRLGEKPLYYCLAGGRLAFASEIKALLKNTSVPRAVDETALDCFLGFEFIPAPMTAFTAVRALPAGHLLTWEEGRADVRPYWRLGAEREERPEAEWHEALRAQLERAVRLRLESDVPLGAFLSGGIDSSTVVAMMRRSGADPIRTFALGYKEAGFSEFSYARRVARHFGTEHSELLIDPITPEIIEKAVWHLDQPFSEFSVLPYYLICRKAREHVTVCLSGEGGDEVFVGYDRFKASRAERWLRRLPAPLRRAAGRLAATLPDRPQKKGALNSLRRFFQGASLPAGGHMRWQYFLTPETARGLFRGRDGEEVLSATLAFADRAAAGSGDGLESEIHSELTFMLPENPLMKVDKMSMACALEIRAPLIDPELVEFACRIPARLKLSGWTTKAVFKKAMADHLPPGIATRPKHGFSFPIKHWLRGDLLPYMEEVLAASPFIRERFHAGAVARMVAEHRGGKRNHDHILWSLVNLALWHRRFLEADR